MGCSFTFILSAETIAQIKKITYNGQLELEGGKYDTNARHKKGVKRYRG
jgi:hypothetical protein